MADDVTATLDWIGPGGSGGDEERVVVKYWIDGTDDYDEAIAALLAEAPPSLGTLLLQSFDATSDSAQLFAGSVTYGAKDLNPSVSFDIGVGSQKITQSLQTISSYAQPGRSPGNNGGAIGVTREGVEGCEIKVPEFTFTETHYLPKSLMTRAYFVTLFNTTAHMNAAAFRGFDIGEVLFLGASGSKSALIPQYEMQFKFLALPNADSLNVNDITGISKLGHDYLWVKYEENISNGSMVKIPREVFVERVYAFSDFDAMGLADPF